MLDLDRYHLFTDTEPDPTVKKSMMLRRLPFRPLLENCILHNVPLLMLIPP